MRSMFVLVHVFIMTVNSKIYFDVLRDINASVLYISAYKIDILKI